MFGLLMGIASAYFLAALLKHKKRAKGEASSFWTIALPSAGVFALSLALGNTEFWPSSSVVAVACFVLWRDARQQQSTDSKTPPSSPVPQPSTPGFTSIIATHAAPAPAPAPMPQVIALPCTFTFSYRSQDGGYSPRTVNVTGISSNGGHAYLDGFCQDRKGNRTFRTDRIRGDLADAETGELVPVKRLLSSVRSRSSMDYKPPAPAPRSRSAAREWQTAVFFAGFRGGKLNELEGLADAAGWQVRGAISHTVDYVVRNGSAGKKQLAEAENLGIPVIDEDTFRTLL